MHGHIVTEAIIGRRKFEQQLKLLYCALLIIVHVLKKYVEGHPTTVFQIKKGKHFVDNFCMAHWETSTTNLCKLYHG